MHIITLEVAKAIFAKSLVKGTALNTVVKVWSNVSLTTKVPLTLIHDVMNQCLNCSKTYKRLSMIKMTVMNKITQHLQCSKEDVFGAKKLHHILTSVTLPRSINICNKSIDLCSLAHVPLFVDVALV